MEPANTNLTEGDAPAEETLEQRLARARAAGDPWAKMAGIFKDDPTFDEWVEIMRENRRKADEELAEAPSPSPFRESTQMQIPVIIEPVSEHCYRATGGSPLALTVEAATPDKALAQLEQTIKDRLTGGTKLVALDIPLEDPALRYAGILRDNPLYDDWIEAMREYREKVDSEPLPWEAP